MPTLNNSDNNLLFLIEVPYVIIIRINAATRIYINLFET